MKHSDFENAACLVADDTVNGKPVFKLTAQDSAERVCAENAVYLT